MTTARTRRTVATMVAVWLLGLFLVLGMWQRVDAACGDDGADPLRDCAPVPGLEPAASATLG